MDSFRKIENSKLLDSFRFVRIRIQIPHPYKYHIGGGGGSDFSAATSPLILKSNYCKLTCWCSMKAHGIREAGLEEVVIFCG